MTGSKRMYSVVITCTLWKSLYILSSIQVFYSTLNIYSKIDLKWAKSQHFIITIFNHLRTNNQGAHYLIR